VRAAIWDRPGELRVDEAPDPEPREGELVVRVGACGMCGTDLHIAEGEFPPTSYPIIPGHEFAGEVVAVGPGVDDGPAEGARVAVDPSLFCGHCEFCRVQRGNLCRNWGAIGDTVDGAFAELVRVPAANAYELPSDIPLTAGALVEPISCAVHGLNRLEPRPGDAVLITGAGTMGLILAQLARRDGAGRVVVVDTNEARLERATELGVSAVAASVEEARADEELGFDIVIDASGAPPAIEQGLDAVRRGGKLMVFGVAPEDARVPFSPFRVYNDEITVLGSMAVLYTFQPAIELLRAGAVDADALLSHTFGLEEFERALETMRQGKGIKVQVLPNGELDGPAGAGAH
jgi:2-desacetyl-2-hydroxyethyl bacteriochlorophyllide A dehydrogenase